MREFMSKKKGPKFKKRRKLNREEIFPKKQKRELEIMEYQISQAFPDLEQRKKYIQSLLDRLDEDIQKGEENES